MDLNSFDGQWIWHPQWSEDLQDTAGGFVHFRKSISITEKPVSAVRIRISADTKYKLFINSQLVSFGPVKGDQHLWFYDDVDLAPFLEVGVNHVAVRVLRFFHATPFATSFPRLQSPGLMIHQVGSELPSPISIRTDRTWETALDLSTSLPTNLVEDDFLHIYESVDYQKAFRLEWIPARALNFPNSHGITPPWKLSPRLIPVPQLLPGRLKALHNVRSNVPTGELERVIVGATKTSSDGVCLKAGTSHHIEIEADQHSTALLAFRFERPASAGSTLRITYSECYENQPISVPYLRSKGDRRDASKSLLGPMDVYRFGGSGKSAMSKQLKYDLATSEDEVFTPFHLRTFRFMALDIQVGDDSDLTFKAIEVTLSNYPLEVRASFDDPGMDIAHSYADIWATSIRTLRNCMHDCYEDCPFYEQLQYVMDTRSSILFTYAVSQDDRLARQAIIQIHNSYVPSLGLTASRAPAHQLQIIPHFSLYWICMIYDHFENFGDVRFVRQFSHTCDAVLETFARDIDPEIGLVRHNACSPHWSFVDWTDSWRPMGIPPAAARTGYLSYTSMLYSYALRAAAKLNRGIGRLGLAGEYDQRAQSLVDAVSTHCFDGQFFTDGLASNLDLAEDYSQHSQLWAVLSGAATGELAASVLRKCLSLNAVKGLKSATSSVLFSPASLAMSFYTLRALSIAGGNLYNEHFHQFWEPWRLQLSQNLTTWEEDTVSQRSDCHAWGCAALYEFTAEVVGLRPGSPGWSKIKFQPRLALFADFVAIVPFGANNGRGLARVEWHTVEDAKIDLTLKLEMDVQRGSLNLPSIILALPGGISETITNEAVINRTVVTNSSFVQ